MTHTPGPWAAKEEWSGLSLSYDIINDDESHVCHTGRWQEHHDEMKANARLISTAPELLDALDDLVRAVENDDGVQSAIAYAEIISEKARGR